MSTILAIESSCDESAVALVKREGDTISVLASEIASQADVHAATGGVIPEVAAREHTAVLPSLVTHVLQSAEMSPAHVDAIAITHGPGLIPALAVGVQAARTLASAWHKPLVPVHHMEGHVYSALLGSSGEFPKLTFHISKNPFPALALLVSGGHTMLVLMKDHLEYDVVGSTRDDAVGEAFDKVARMLDLPYPGGPALSQLALQGDESAHSFTAPMVHADNLDFSFSGLKTEVRYTVRDTEPLSEQAKADIAASFERAAVTALCVKTKRALELYQPTSLLVAGGVAANQRLRNELQQLADTSEVSLQSAPLALCGDNAVMIGLAGALALERGRTVPWPNVDAHARLTLPLKP